LEAILNDTRYVPNTENNLPSLEQLLEKGYALGIYSILHPEDANGHRTNSKPHPLSLDCMCIHLCEHENGWDMMLLNGHGRVL